MGMSPDDKKTETVKVTLSKAEKEFLRNTARTVGISISELVRLVLIYQVVELPKPDYVRNCDKNFDKDARRSNNIQIMVTDEEKSALKEKAASLGCTVSDYMRRSALQGETNMLDLSLEPLESLKHEYRKQGVNLNQLMYFLNRTKGKNYNDKEVAAVLKKVRKTAALAYETLAEIREDYHQRKDAQ